MIKHILKDDGFITVTTRKANFVDLYFGKFTFWKSKEDYQKGNCTGAITYTNIPLGNCEPYLEIEANRFIDNTRKEKK